MIPALIADWAKRTPEKPALIYNGRAYSYAAFATLIARARGFFARRGVTGPGIAVLAVRNLMDFWVLSLAARSLGLTTVTVDTIEGVKALDIPEVRYVMASKAVPWAGLEDLCTAREWAFLSVSLDGEAPLVFDPSRKRGGHILMTSGTTGTHKMLLSTPATDAHYLRSLVTTFAIGADSIFSVFDFPGWTGAGYKWAAAPWLVGGAALIEQRPERYRALQQPGLTHATLVPATLDVILAAPEGAFARSETLTLAVGGGAMTPAQIEHAKARISPLLYNWFGSTEAGGIACTRLDTLDDRRWHRIVPGRVVQIVDDDGNSVRAGETGRLRVKVAGGPSGYFYNDEATRDFFKDGYFYTGDLAAMREDCRMALMGRVTDVLNISGNKISPAELEARLSDMIGGRAVCLFSMPDNNGDENIHVAIETSDPGDTTRLTPALDEVFGHRPVHLHVTQNFPRSTMGKILRRQLRAELAAAPAQGIVIGLQSKR